MKQFLDDLINKPFKPIVERGFNIQGENISFPNEHSGTFTIIPEVLRRCHFLSSTEKEVLYELISWASTTKKQPDGYCKVTESHIRVNTTLGLSTVKKAISSLAKKGFIRKAVDFDRRNIYVINGASENPYVILSEWVHLYRKRMIDNWSVGLIDDPGADYLLGKRVFIDATMLFVKEEKYHAKSILTINELINKIFDGKSACNYSDEIFKAYSAIQDEIDEIYENYQFTIK
ncbi:hypothetical protein MKY34_07775 [Sporosarcina sp. FSL K6-1522]|uniref:hypothetical protein n=1 Tax=Sporosarcina sp. FSL K6-1522 TaxID=2921554 RepID=UPI00315AA96A